MYFNYNKLASYNIIFIIIVIAFYIGLIYGIINSAIELSHNDISSKTQTNKIIIISVCSFFLLLSIYIIFKYIS